MSAARVFDSDIVDPIRGPRLIGLMIELLNNYRGNWDALNEWKRLVGTSHQWDDKEVRQVLNMLITTGPEAASAIISVLPTRTVTVGGSSRMPRLRVVREPERAFRVNGNAVIKATYGHPATEFGRVHLINHDRTVLWWEPGHIVNVGGWDYEHRGPVLHLVWRCGRQHETRRPGRGYGTPIQLHKEWSTIEDHRSWCKNCQRIALVENS